MNNFFFTPYWKKIIVPAACVAVAIGIFGNPATLKSDDLKKANKYYEHYDYQFAIEIYEKLMDRKPSLDIAQKLANCYRFTNNTLKAEKAYEKVLTFPGFDPVNYIYYGDVLKQNGKFDEAKQNYLMYAERNPAKADEAVKLAHSCDVARMWMQNPDEHILFENELKFNSSNSDFSPVKYKEGFIFSSDRDFIAEENKNKGAAVYGWTGNPYLKLYYLEDQAGKSKLTLLPKEVNLEFHNGPASLTKDGSLLAFTRSGTVDDSEKKKKDHVIYRKAIYFSKNNKGLWTESLPFPYNNPYQYSVQHPALSADGNLLYFASDMPGGFGGMDLYYSEKKGSTWTKPVNCGPAVNTAEDEVFPYLRDDGKLFFASRGHLTIGGLDIFSANGERDNWSEPQNLKAPINSPKDDFGISFTTDTLTGYVSSNRAGGKGLDDIYSFKIRPAKALFFAVEGKVVEKGTEIPVPAVQIFLLNRDSGQEISATSAEDGTFRFDLEKDANYVVKGDVNKFFNRQEGDFSTKNLKESTIFNVKFELEKGEDAYLVRLKNIYYDFDKYNIRADARPDLNKVLVFLSKTPHVNIELRSHTDSRGTASYNLWLSEQRALSAKNYLLKNGADENRLSAKGFGETQLINQCADGVQCSEEEHQMNRRTEFKVIKIDPMMASQ